MPALATSLDWAPLFSTIGRGLLTKTLQKGSIPAIVELASAAIARHQGQEALNWIMLGLYCYPDRMANEIRRQGLFRSSKYEFHGPPVRQVVSDLVSRGAVLELSPGFLRYLESVSNLLRAGPSVGALLRSIRSFIERRPPRVLKSVVAAIDSIFMIDHQPSRASSFDNWKRYTKEDLAEGASYIISQFDNIIGLSDHHFNDIDKNALIRGRYHSLLVDACKIRCFLEAEILLDAFDYTCHHRKKVLTIHPSFPDFEKSIRLGYIQADQASDRLKIDRIALMKHGWNSIYKIADEYYDNMRGAIVRRLEWPVARFVFVFPDALSRIFSDDRFFVEEYLSFQEIIDAEIVTHDELWSFEIVAGVQVRDLLKVHRVFAFLRHVTKRHLQTVFVDEPGLAWRSLVPVFHRRALHRLLGWALPPAKCTRILSMLTRKPGDKALLDLQYRPVIQGQEYLLVPMNVLGTTNLYRNLAHTQKRRALESAEEEAASRALSNILGRVTGHVRKGFRTRFGDRQIEIDVVCRFDEYLFIFECKHPLLPCNVHELRTSYEHIKKAALTLSRIRALIVDEGQEEELYKRLGWRVTNAKEVVTCIVSCNGMFPGLMVDGHPVRRWPELSNMIEAGMVRMGPVQVVEDNGGLGLDTRHVMELCVWDGSELTATFLREYIAGGWLQQDLLAAMVEREDIYRVKDWQVRFSTYALDPGDAMRRLRERFGIKDSDETKVMRSAMSDETRLSSNRAKGSPLRGVRCGAQDDVGVAFSECVTATGSSR